MRVLGPFVGRLADALAHAKAAGELRRDAAAERLWGEVYGTLKRAGEGSPHCDRARPYVVRLSLLYALADRSPAITEAHLRAALAVWGYCEASARRVFGHAKPTADPLAERLLGLIRGRPGVTRSELLRLTRAKADALGDALASLEAASEAHRGECRHPAGGPPAECWWPGPGPERDNNKHPPICWQSRCRHSRERREGRN